MLDLGHAYPLTLQKNSISPPIINISLSNRLIFHESSSEFVILLIPFNGITLTLLTLLITPFTMPHPTVETICKMFQQRGDSRYGGEAVTQLQHALQAATFAEATGASPALIAAALLHDIGHLLHDLPADAPDRGIDDAHEELAARWLMGRFPPSVVAPVQLHVTAKRFLCTTDAVYLKHLSGPSLQSLQLQGGLMNDEELTSFRNHPHFTTAIQLRRWDEAAKDPTLQTPPLEHFVSYLQQVAL